MAKVIQQLSPGVVKKLRSGIAFTNVAHCVEELVLNSIDAGANCVAVNLNLPVYQIQVVDNGCGISAEQMKIIGTRYATSKCHTLEDLQDLKSGGFRGEALASLKEVSSVLMIESRTSSSIDTFCKIFTQGKALDPTKSLNSRPSKGTTVSVYDFMYNMPVRKKSISYALDLEECRKLLQSIALMYPNISFTLKNEATEEMCLQLKKCSSLYHAFFQVFGKSKAINLKNVDYQKDDFEISGCISTDCHISKDLQFLYVNKRHVLRTKLHKLINSILNKVLSSKQKSSVASNGLTSDTSSPKNQSHCIFAINISCPYDKYDIIFEPRKTMIEFSEWDTVLKVVEDALVDFLKRENLYTSIDETNILNYDSGERANLPKFNAQDCQQGLFSHVVRRLKFPELDDLNKSEKNLIQNFYEDDMCKAFISSATKEKAASKFNNKSISTIEESSSVHTRKGMESPDKESGIYPRNHKSNVSLLDDDRLEIEKNYSKTIKGYASKLHESEFDIPCRSVFPSQNPVMLRVPLKSELSDLQTSSSNSNLLKLKEKIQCFVRKGNPCPLNRDRFQRKCEKNSHGLNDNTEKTPENKLKQDCQFLNIYEAKLREFRQMKMINKSSQCPSVSNSSQNTAKELHKNDAKENFIVKETRDKNLQCPSVSLEKQAKVVSRFAFKEESTLLPLKRLKQSKKVQSKSSKKPHSKGIAVADNLIDCLIDDVEISKAKKLKSSHIIQDSLFSNNDTGERNKNLDMDLDDFRISSENRAISERTINNLNTILGVDDLDSFTDSSKKLKNSDTDGMKNFNFDKFKSCFSLKTFSKTKNPKHCADNTPIFTELEKSHCLHKDKLLYQYDEDLDNYISEDQINIFQKFTPRGILNADETITNVNDIEVKEYCLPDKSLDSNSNEDMTFIDGNIHMDFRTSSENSLPEKVLQVDSSKILPDVKEIVYGMIHNLDSDNDEVNTFCNSSNEINLKTNDITEDVQNVSCLNFLNKTNNSSIPRLESDKSHSDSSSVPLSALDVKSVSNVEMETDPFTEKLPYIENLETLQEKSCQENNSSNKNMSNCLTDPFTEKLPCIENLVTLQEKSSQENNSSNKNTSNCLSPELFKEPVLKSPVIGVEDSTNEELISKASETVSNRNELNLQVGFVRPENDNSKSLYTKEPDVEIKMSRNWKLHSESKFERKIYIDAITGNSSYNDPKLNETVVKETIGPNNGVLKKSHFFLTHDYSPFTSKTQTPDYLKKIYCSIQNDLKDFMENNEKHEWHKKWRCNQDGSNYNDNIESMLCEWNNPMFDIPYEVNSVADNKISQNVSQMYTFLNSYRFSRSTLSSLQVIGQVDCKFIACILKDFNENCRDQRLLALFDQHAVHERIRLEELTEDLYETDGNGEKLVKTSAINLPLELSFNDEESRLLQAYNDKLHKIGIHINIDNESSVYSIHSVPSCLVHKETGELRRSVPDTITILQNSVTEWITSVVKTRSLPQVLPKTLLSVLNYQACRGAVKFGDPLSLEKCSNLMKSLSTCKLPFQCAHGRPSVAPILDLKKIEALYKKRPPPQLQMLLKNQAQE